MKLTQLKLKNFTSLQGQHHIDFCEISDHSDLFSITGPTGSGKSSLLAAIGLALYGDHYKSTLTQVDFVAQTKATARVELTFEKGGHEYLAKWECRKLKKDGTPLKIPKVSRLMFKDGEPCDLNASDILGLDFEQFGQTIVLGQGQFAKFLHSSFNDRKGLLEKIMGQYQLSGLNQTLNQKVKKNRWALDQVSSKIEGVQLYTDEERSQWKQQLLYWQGIEKQLNQSWEWSKDLLQALGDFRQSCGRQLELQKKKHQTQKQLELQQKVLLSVQQEEHVNIKKRQQFQDLQLERTPKILQAIENFKISIEKEKDQKELELEVQQKREWKKNIQVELGKKQLQLKGWKEKITLLKDTLDTVADGNREAQLEHLRDKVSKNQKRVLQLHREKQELLHLSTRLNTFSQKLIPVRQSLVKLEQNVTKGKALVDQIVIKLQTLEELQQKQKVQQSINDCHQLARESGVCPVCAHDYTPGVSQHPAYHSTGPLVQEDQIKQLKLQLSEQQAQVGRWEGELAIKQELVEEFNQEWIELAKTAEAYPPPPFHLAEASSTLQKWQVIQTEKLNMLKQNIQQAQQAEINYRKDQKTLDELNSASHKVDLLNGNIAADQHKIHEAAQDESTLTAKIIQKVKEQEKLLAQFPQYNSLNQAKMELEKLQQMAKDWEVKSQQLRERGHSHQLEVGKLEQSLQNLELELKETTEQKSILLESLDKLWKSRPNLESITEQEIQDKLQAVEIDIQLGIHDDEQLFAHLSLQLERLNLYLDLLAKSQEHVSTEKGQIQGKMEGDRKRGQMLGKMKKDQQQYQLLGERLDQLKEVLGKDEFRNFALAKVEEHLIELANFELEHFFEGRYRLIHKTRKTGVLYDFFVIDHFHPEGKRKISTLSGGETFLLSLAMALGLGHLLSQQTQLDCFFIDEGFGQLDRDCLEQVIEVLFELRGRGKQIGVITHIDELAKRIPVNLQLSKNQGQHTSIHLNYN